MRLHFCMHIFLCQKRFPPCQVNIYLKHQKRKFYPKREYFHREIAKCSHDISLLLFHRPLFCKWKADSFVNEKPTLVTRVPPTPSLANLKSPPLWSNGAMLTHPEFLNKKGHSLKETCMLRNSRREQHLATVQHSNRYHGDLWRKWVTRCD